MWFDPRKNKNIIKPPPAILAIPAILQDPQTDTESRESQKSQGVESSAINHSDTQRLLDYLAAIGETDQDVIDEYLTECGKDAAVLAIQLQQADDVLQLQRGDFCGFVQCSGCRQLSGDTCQLHGWRVVVDKWRRCSDFLMIQKTSSMAFITCKTCEDEIRPPREDLRALITCKTCEHFQSFNTHGGGAGSCNAGVTLEVYPVGARQASDAEHAALLIRMHPKSAQHLTHQ
jgi:hypothetical protein